ncbi:MAG: 2-amino-4-hydroxy-6-hydroxymethyldihydropteridine diphosphokinase [Prevotella sp.]|nr:2-amino-4-hydroxy-6-hydroxymethyldihydropteridine diphosphokinase [Prevotella sp.]
MTSHQVYLGLGSNLGDREGNIRKAIDLLHERVGEVVRQSSLIETVPWGFESEHRFLNGVILCETTLTPRQVLKATQKIERELGKTKAHATKRQLSMLNSQFPTFKDRPIDIDILLYDDWKVDEPDLKIPHPLMRERDFVMIPLKEIL